MKKHERLLELAKLVGWKECWGTVDHPDEYVNHVRGGIETLKHDNRALKRRNEVLKQENVQLRAQLKFRKDPTAMSVFDGLTEAARLGMADFAKHHGGYE